PGLHTVFAPAMDAGPIERQSREPWQDHQHVAEGARFVEPINSSSANSSPFTVRPAPHREHGQVRWPMQRSERVPLLSRASTSPDSGVLLLLAPSESRRALPWP